VDGDSIIQSAGYEAETARERADHARGIVDGGVRSHSSDETMADANMKPARDEIRRQYSNPKDRGYGRTCDFNESLQHRPSGNTSPR
jgi:hypothetical protein